MSKLSYLAGDRFLAMNLSFRGRLKRASAAIGKLVKELLRCMTPKVLPLLSAPSMCSSLLFKLFVAEYSIEFSAFARAASRLWAWARQLHFSTGRSQVKGSRIIDAL